MRRRLIAAGLASLLTFNAIPAPLFAADLGMPLKAPPIVAPPPEDIMPIVVAGLIFIAIGVCIAECSHQECHSPPC
jgi:hypothetical protein